MSEYTHLYNRSQKLRNPHSDTWTKVHSDLHDEASRINHKIGYKGPSWHGHDHHDTTLIHARHDAKKGSTWGPKAYLAGGGLAGIIALNPHKIKGTSKRALAAAGITAGGLALHDVATKIRRKRNLAEAERVDAAFKHEVGIV